MARLVRTYWTTVASRSSYSLADERYQNERAFSSVYKENCANGVLQIEPREPGVGMLRVKVRQTKSNFGGKVAPFGMELAFSEENVEVTRFPWRPGSSRGLSRTTLWKLLSAGEIRATRVGHSSASIAVLWSNTWSRLQRVCRTLGGP
jgi:hypothetical protein